MKSDNPFLLIICLFLAVSLSISLGAANSEDLWNPANSSQLIRNTTSHPQSGSSLMAVMERNNPSDGDRNGVINGSNLPPDSTYFISRKYRNGKQVDEWVIGPGLPPKGWVSGPNKTEVRGTLAKSVGLDEVPALDWSYGCSATAASMYFGYFDRNGYSDLYQGPTNGGDFPLTNAVWGHGECPLTASHQGIDGRTTKGHVDDYYLTISSITDPYYVGNWTEHTPDSVADFMGTSQFNKWHNPDGSTRFWFEPDGSPLYDHPDSVSAKERDGTHGMRLFAEAAGYTVTTNYNQYIYGYKGNTKGFTFAQYKAEIDDGYPVIIQLEGHSILGVGYIEPNIIIFHNTWDYTSHTMIWGGSYSDMQQFAVAVFHMEPITYPPPSITSIAPSSAQNTGTAQVTIDGDNFRTGVVVNLTNGSYSIPGSVTSRVKRKLTCTFPVSGAPQWTYNLTVRNKDGQNTTLENGFTVMNSTPIILTVTPGSGYNSDNVSLTITGTGFRSGVSLSLVNGSTTIPGVITSRTTSKILSLFTLEGEPAGYYNLSILNLDGLSTSKVNAFNILSAGGYPTIDNFTPISGSNKVTLPFIVNGSNFRTGATITITNTTVSKTVATTRVSEYQLKCSLPLLNLPIGKYNLTVRNSDGSRITLQDAFTVTNPTPVITSITPTFGFNSSQVQLTISGTNYVSGCTVFLTNQSTNVSGNIILFTPTRIIGLFDLSGSPAGLYNITIINPGGPETIRSNLFTVRSPGYEPTIANITPDFGVNTAPLMIMVNGTNFRSGATVTITNNSVRKTVPITLINSGQIKCTLPLTGLPIGMYNISVWNLDGSNTTLDDGFQVKNPVPIITALTPVLGFTTGATQISISGSRFMNGMNSILQNGSTNTTITGSVSGFTPTRFTGTFPLSGAPAGVYNLTLINPGGQSETKKNCFTVKNPQTGPHISSFNPVSGDNTGIVALTLNGSGFRTGATVTIVNETSSKTGSGVLIGTNLIKCSLPLTGLPIGLYNITVRNSDGSNVTLLDAFKVENPVPLISAITPPSAYSLVPTQLVISGGKFVNGVEVSLENQSTIIPGNVSGLTSTKFTVTFPLAGAPEGRYNLTVTNPGNRSAKKQNCFTLTPVGYDPIISNISPTSGINTGLTPVVVNGQHFRAGLTVSIINGTLQKTVAAVFLSSKQVRCSLPLSGMPIGTYDLKVRNSDGSNGTLAGGFMILNPLPAISSITPLSGYNTGPVRCTIKGAGFVSGAGVFLENSTSSTPGSGISYSATTIVCSFPLDGMSAGTYNITVSNPDSRNGTKVNAFTIKDPGSLPQISSLNPVSGFNSGSLPVTITGSNFVNPTVYINQGIVWKQAISTPGKVSTATIRYVTLPLTGLSGGFYNLTVQNSDGLNSTVHDIFYLTDQAWISKGIKAVQPSMPGHSPVTPQSRIYLPYPSVSNLPGLMVV